MIHRFLVRPGLLLAVLPCLLLPACQDGHLELLGYSTRPLHDPKYKTIRVVMAENRTFNRGLEFELTDAVVHRIQMDTTMRVVGLDCAADTELKMVIKSYDKGVLNVTQQNEIREESTSLTVDVVWKDLHTGEILSSPKRGVTNPPLIPGTIPMVGRMPTPQISPADQPPPPLATEPGTTPLPPGTGPMPTPLPPAPGTPPVPPATVVSQAFVIPELGVSNAAARQKNVDKLAVQIVSMMEAPWPAPQH